MINCLVTGFSGRLGTALAKFGEEVNFIDIPVDILDAGSLADMIESEDKKCFYSEKGEIDALLHLAAYTSVDKAEVEKEECYKINVLGTKNVAAVARDHHLPVVYISTDYIFDGIKGNYAEGDVPNPTNFYGLTKLLGETIIQEMENFVTVRTSFKPDIWPYEFAYEDMITTAGNISEIAQELLLLLKNIKELKYKKTIFHIASERRTMLELARKSNPEVKGISLKTASYPVPKDVSLNCLRWEEFKKIKRVV